MAKERVSVALLLTFLLGCHQPVRPFTPNLVANEHVFQRNYEIGKPQTVYVGEAVVKFKDYFIRKLQGRTMRPSVDFRYTFPLRPWYYVSSTLDYPVTGSLMIKGSEYSVVNVKHPSQPSLAFLVDSTGKPYKKLLIGDLFSGDNAKFDPPNVTFLPGPDEVKVDTSAGFKNFELVYGGTDGKSFTFTYREYTPEDLIRPAFTQTLTYPNGSTSVRYRQTLLAITEVTSEKIMYTVIADESAAKK